MLCVPLQKETSSKEKEIFGIVTCRLRDLMIPPSLRPSSIQVSGFSHSLDDSIQKLQLLSGEKNVPDYLAPIVFGKPASAERKKMIQILGEKFGGKKVGALVIEWSSLKKFSVSGFDINPSYLGSLIVRKGGLDYLDWWKFSSNGKPFEDSKLLEMVENRGDIDADLFDDESLFRILSEFNAEPYSTLMVNESMKKIEHHSENKDLIFLTPFDTPRINKIIQENDVISSDRKFIDTGTVINEIGPEKAFMYGGRSTAHFEPECIEALSKVFYSYLNSLISK